MQKNGHNNFLVLAQNGIYDLPRHMLRAESILLILVNFVIRLTARGERIERKICVYVPRVNSCHIYVLMSE
jgi:hypothetical protein